MDREIKEQVESLLADSRLAFIQGKNEEALKLANEVMKLDKTHPDAYLCAGNAYMSFGQYDKAVECYRNAVKYDSGNGDRYFHLGYALSANKKEAEGLAAFAKADEIGTSPEVAGEMYKILGMICFDMRSYNDAIINLCKAETIIGIDMDILQRKALSYGMIGEYAKGLEIANQMKLFSPTAYLGYRIAREILLQDNRVEDADAELDRAQKFAKPTSEYFTDRLTSELGKYIETKDKTYLDNALKHINDALFILEPAVDNVVDCYINAAEVYVQMEDADMAVSCLNAAENPIESYNSGFMIRRIQNEKQNINVRPSEREIERAIEDARRRYGEREIERIGRENEKNMSRAVSSNAAGEHLTPINRYEQKIDVKKMDEDQSIHYTEEKTDQINRLYIAAYTIKKDTQHIKLYASKLAESKNKQNVYIGKYSLVKALKDEGYDKTKDEYQELIRYLRNESIKDPSDLMALSFRIQCFIDIKEYEKAEKYCGLLSDDLKKPLLEQIKEAKAKGENQ